MALSQLSISDFRNLAQVDLSPLLQGFNFLYGLNGSGKTSLLEAIYYLGHRRSFRSQLSDRLIRHQASKFNLFTQIHDQFGQSIPLGMEKLEAGDYRVRIAGQDIVSLHELTAYLPIRLINVHSHYLLEGSPQFRRQYLDWGVFYQRPEFQALWFRYKRLLKQRNAALKRRATVAEVQSWSEELAEAALSFHALRLAYLEQLLPVLRELLNEELQQFFDLSQLNISYSSGWNESLSFAEVLNNNLAKDFERGFTQVGPHRADLSLKISGIPVKDVLSTGQQKLLVCGMILAQGALLAKLSNKCPIYLIDDLPAELDHQSRGWLIATLAAQKAQIFVTAVDAQGMSELLSSSAAPVKMFHVKHGEIIECLTTS